MFNSCRLQIFGMQCEMLNDLNKIVHNLGFHFEVEHSYEDGIDGFVAKLVLMSDSYTTKHQAAEDLQRRAVEMLEAIINANRESLGLSDDERELFAKTPVDSCVGDQAEVKSLWPECLTQLCDEAKKEKPLP